MTAKSKVSALVAAGGVPELVLDDESLPTVRAELEALDLQAVQHRAVGEPIAVGVGDELRGGRQDDVPTSRRLRNRGPEAVDQLDRVEPDPAHLARQVFAQIREIPVLGSDHVRPGACRDVGLASGLPVIAEACQDGGGVVGLRPGRTSIRQQEE